MNNLRISGAGIGFAQHFDNDVIEKIVCNTSSGVCTVHFHNRPPKDLDIGCSGYNHQYGIPISKDGSKLFVGSWDRSVDGVKKGLVAYDIETGSVLWRFHQGRIRNVFVYDDYVVASKSYEAIYKFNIENGEMLEKVKGTTVDHIFDTGTKYVLTETLSIIDTEKMISVKKYSSKIANPLNSGFFYIEGAALQSNKLTISGWEQPPQWTYDSDSPRGVPFERVIDTDFYDYQK